MHHSFILTHFKPSSIRTLRNQHFKMKDSFYPRGTNAFYWDGIDLNKSEQI